MVSHFFLWRQRRNFEYGRIWILRGRRCSARARYWWLQSDIIVLCCILCRTGCLGDVHEKVENVTFLRLLIPGTLIRTAGTRALGDQVGNVVRLHFLRLQLLDLNNRLLLLLLRLLRRLLNHHWLLRLRGWVLWRRRVHLYMGIMNHVLIDYRNHVMSNLPSRHSMCPYHNGPLRCRWGSRWPWASWVVDGVMIGRVIQVRDRFWMDRGCSLVHNPRFHLGLTGSLSTTRAFIPLVRANSLRGYALWSHMTMKDCIFRHILLISHSVHLIQIRPSRG